MKSVPRDETCTDVIAYRYRNLLSAHGCVSDRGPRTLRSVLYCNFQITTREGREAPQTASRYASFFV